MSAWRSMSFYPNTQYTNSESPYGADSTLTCNKRCSTEGDEGVWAGLQVSHHMFHHSVHSLDQTADHRDGLLLNNDHTETCSRSTHSRCIQCPALFHGNLVSHLQIIVCQIKFSSEVPFTNLLFMVRVSSVAIDGAFHGLRKIIVIITSA